MREFSKRTYWLSEGIYQTGPWVLFKEHARELTWQIVINDWDSYFRPIITTIQPRRTAIQAGGWQGLYPYLLSKEFKTVYTFEPMPMNFYCLSQNCQEDNIFKFQAALSNYSGLIEFERTITTGQARIKSKNNWKIPVLGAACVPVMTIDSFNIVDCDLIMLDVESHEFGVLQGSEQTIRRCRPFIITEKNFNVDENSKTIKYLKSLGYEIAHTFPNDLVFKWSGREQI